MRTFHAVIERDPESGLYIGHVPGWRGAHSLGTSLDELEKNLRDIVEMKLRAVARRIEESHRVPTELDPKLLDALADRCTDPETGARNVDHVLRGSLLPLLSGKLLERMAVSIAPKPSGASTPAWDTVGNLPQDSKFESAICAPFANKIMDSSRNCGTGMTDPSNLKPFQRPARS